MMIPVLDSGKVMWDTDSLPSPLLQVNSSDVEGEKKPDRESRGLVLVTL